MTNRITAISPQKKRTQRFNIYIENEYAFSLSASLAMTLHTESILSDQEIAELKTADEIEQSFSKALFYLTYRPRSTKEIIQYLTKKEFEPPIIEATLKRLQKYNYINDAEFARLWVEDRKRHRPRGLFALRHELKGKGIDEETIQKALLKYNELEPAWRAISARLQGWSSLPEFELKIKTYNFLKQRGFSYETCEETFNRAIKALTDNDAR